MVSIMHGDILVKMVLLGYEHMLESVAYISCQSR